MIMRYHLGFGVGHVHTNAPRHLCHSSNKPDVPATDHPENSSDLKSDEADEDARSIDFDRLSSGSEDGSDSSSDDEPQLEAEAHAYAEDACHYSDEWESNSVDSNDIELTGKYKY